MIAMRGQNQVSLHLNACLQFISRDIWTAFVKQTPLYRVIKVCTDLYRPQTYSQVTLCTALYSPVQTNFL